MQSPDLIEVSAKGGRSWVVQLFFLATIWFLTSLSRFPVLDGSSAASPIWPALGLALGIVLVCGERFLLLFFITLFAWFMSHGYTFWPSLLIALEQFFCCGLALFLIRRYGEVELIGTLQGTLRFYALIVLLVLPLFSLFDAWVYQVFDFFRGLHYVNIAAFNWLAEALGMVLLAPLAQYVSQLLLRQRSWSRPSFASITLWLVFGLLAVGALWLARKGHSNYAGGLSATFFIVICWAAVYGRRFSALLLLPAAAVVSLASVHVAGLAGVDALNALGNAVIFSVALVLMGHLVLAASTETRASIRSLVESSRRDALTDELNRSGLLYAYESLSAEKRSCRRLLMTLCIRNFDSSRDMLPESVLLESQRWVARQLRQVLEVELTDFALARIENGVFSMLCDISDTAQASGLTQAVMTAVQGHRFALESGSYRLEPTVGALMLEPQEDLAEGLAATRHLAQQAMGTPARPVLFGTDYHVLMQEQREKTLQLETVKEAIVDSRFVLYGQRIIPLQAEGKSKMELLIRMRGDEGLIIAPGVFLSAASRFGYMADIDRWVIASAFSQLADRVDLFSQIDVFSINLSGASLIDPDVLEHIDACHANSGLKAKHFCFEVTETEQIQDWIKARSILLGLKQRGFAISLDDFGTGLASFDYLNRLDFDYVKIDGSFVKGVSEDSRNHAIIKAIVLVAKSRGMHTIAEFVETEAERQLLVELQVDYAQGYVAHKPEELAKMHLAY